MGADKDFWADEVIAESSAKGKKKKREELSLFRQANWKQKEDLIDVCRCRTLRRETNMSECWLRLNESRLATDTVRVEMKRRLLNSRAVWNRNFWTSLSSEEWRTLGLCCPERKLVSLRKAAKGVVPVIAGPCYFQSFPGSSFTSVPLCFIIWIVSNRKPLLPSNKQTNKPQREAFTNEKSRFQTDVVCCVFCPCSTLSDAHFNPE